MLKECSKCESRNSFTFFMIILACILGISFAFVTKNELRRDIRNEIIKEMLENETIERVER